MSEPISPAWKVKSAQALQERILEAAAQAIAEEGADALRLDRLARAVGCSRSSLYRYFDTKDELIIAVLARRIEQMSERVSIELADVTDPAEHVVLGIARSVELARSDPHFAFLFSEPNSPTVVRIAGSALPRLVGSLVGGVLPSSEQRGWLPQGVPPEEVARWIVMVFVGLLTFDSERAADREALIPYLERFLVPSLFGAGAWQRDRRDR